MLQSLRRFAGLGFRPRFCLGAGIRASCSILWVRDRIMVQDLGVQGSMRVGFGNVTLPSTLSFKALGTRDLESWAVPREPNTP